MQKLLRRSASLIALLMASNAAFSHHVDGYVYCDTNENNIIDVEDSPLGGALILVESHTAGSFNATSNNIDGFYNITLPTGIYATYNMSIDISTLPADAVIVDPVGNVASFDITPSQLIAEQHWLINSEVCREEESEKGAIGDYTWFDNDQNGLQEDNEAGVSGLEVSLYQCATGGSDPTVLLATTLTDSNGRYLFDNLDAGRYQVEFILPVNSEFTQQDQSTGIPTDDLIDSDANISTGITECIDLAQGETNLTIDAGIYTPTGLLGDKVWFDENQDGLQDVSEAGAAGVNVDLFRCGNDGVAGTADDVLLSSTLTDGAGNYLFSDLIADDYVVLFSNVPGYEFTAQNQGTNDGLDSDADMNGLASCTSLLTGEVDLTWDAGLFVPSQTCDLNVTLDATPDTVQPHSEANCEVLGKPTSLTFRYTGGGCASSDNVASNSSKPPSCVGGIDSLEDVVVSAYKGQKGDKGTYTVSSNLVSPGGLVTVSADKFDSWSQFSISNNGQTESNTVHTSCSAPLEVGDVFGSLTLVAFNGIEGSGSDATITYTVTNTGDDLDDLQLDGSPFGHQVDIGAFASGASETFSFIEEITGATDLSVVATGTLVDSQICSASANNSIDFEGCSVQGGNLLKIDNDKIEWSISNIGNQVITIDNLSIEWPDALGELKKVKLDGSTIFDKKIPPASALISEWKGKLKDRQIKIGDNKRLKVEFEDKESSNQGDYKIIINFVEGCSITFTPGPNTNSSFDCVKPIDRLSMIWAGSSDVTVKAWKGDVGSSTLLSNQVPVAVGEELSVSGYAGSPNNVYWEVFDAASQTKIGESVFHLSCSDQEMNGPEDCGARQGNGKSDTSSFLNLWILEGMVDKEGTLDCTP